MQLLHADILGPGNSPALLVFHGLFGSGGNWMTLGRRLARDYAVHLIDLRNHGRSFHSSVMTLDAMGEDVARYVAHYQLQEAYLLGHSLGGKLAMYYAINHPENVSKLVVVDISPRRYTPHHHAIFQALAGVDLCELRTRPQVEARLANYLNDLGVRQFLMKGLYRSKADKPRFKWRFNLPALVENYGALIAELPGDRPFTKPTLFIRGEKSDYITAADTPLIQARFPNSVIETVSGVGHWLHAENPQECYQRVMSFLSAQ
ncbi:MAG: alpha/beta fold hydrolase [Flavobacteriales bacterium]